MFLRKPASASSANRRRVFVLTLAAWLGGGSAVASPQPAADPLSDAPEARAAPTAPFLDAPSYAEALRTWRSAADLNAWIGARFSYDKTRAIQLSETQRQKNGRLPIIAPPEFFAQPSGVCVDLSRFAVETLRQIDPAAKASYVMIEFDPLTVQGHTLRRHWVATFESAGQRYFFADSKRPGFVAGPYADTQQFIDEYAKYRGRRIVAFQERASFERQLRQQRRGRDSGDNRRSSDGRDSRQS